MFEISKQKTWVIFKRFFILIHNVYWIRDYIHLKNSQILKKEKLYKYHTKINKVDVMSMRTVWKVETQGKKKTL